MRTRLSDVHAAVFQPSLAVCHTSYSMLLFVPLSPHFFFNLNITRFIYGVLECSVWEDNISGIVFMLEMLNPSFVVHRLCIQVHLYFIIFRMENFIDAL
jgi:hypothetical protein